MARYLESLVAIGMLLLVGARSGWAGPGDIDPAFNAEGRVGASTFSVSLVLPDDRVVFGYPGSGYTVGRFDANGAPDPTFGNDGETRIALPASWPFFYASFASATPEGGVLLAGTQHDQNLTHAFDVVLHLDRDGNPVTSFGGQGDGFYRLTDVPFSWQVDGGITTILKAITVDGSGRVLLAERGWSADGRCGPTQIVRLMPGGTRDVTFGTNGRADAPGVDVCDGAALFGARNDGSIVIGARGTIVGLDANGALDLAFGHDGQVSHGEPGDWGRGVLLADGGILIVERDSATAASNTLLTKINRLGQPDPAFGAGSGSVKIEFGSSFFGIADTRQSVSDFVLAPDGEHVYLKLVVLRSDGSMACAGGIARVALDGSPDVGFGRQGLTCLDFGASPFMLVGSQRDGSPLFGASYGPAGGLYRLLMDATPSPGLLVLVQDEPFNISETDGALSVRVMRTAGHDGAVAADFSTGPWMLEYDYGQGLPPDNAWPGDDFDAVNGRLDWADGDDTMREITVRLTDDAFDEPVERFRVGISYPQGGVQIPEFDSFPDGFTTVDVAINDDDEAVLPPPQSAPTNGSGGGGALSWPTFFALLGLFLRRRRRRTSTLDRLKQSNFPFAAA